MNCGVDILQAKANKTGNSSRTKERTLTIHSVKQLFTKHKNACFEGAVDAQIGSHLHVWAERITAFHETRELFAESLTGAPVVVEDNGILIFADSFSINIDTKTGEATNVRLHMRDGFAKARKARKLSALDWEMWHIEYTACDRTYPEWNIRAKRAMFRRGSFIRTHNVSFNIGKNWVCGVPQFIIPVQFGTGAKKTSKSGFLLPRFLIDYDYGLGLKQDYYKTLTDQADTTFGIDWRNKKGFVFADEFRWYRSAEDYTYLRSHYVIVHDRYIYENNLIRKGTTRGFWMKGKSFHQHAKLTPQFDAAALIRTDFGTDKRMEYHFFSDTDDVDDAFLNGIDVRALSDYTQVSALGAWNRVYRTRFLPIKGEELQKIIAQIDDPDPGAHQVVKKDIEERTHVGYLPHVEINNTFRTLFSLPLQYRHDFFWDYIVSRQQTVDRIFVNNSFLEAQDALPYKRADMVRCRYAPHIKGDVPVPYGVLTAFCKPVMQVAGVQKELRYEKKNEIAGSLFSRGGYRAYLAGGAGYAFPLAFRHLEQSDALFFAQPLVTWHYVPRLYQENWYHLDRFDRAYPTNSITAETNLTLNKGNWCMDLAVRQGYDFVSTNRRFYMLRSLQQQHVTPLQYDCRFSNDKISCGLQQEYDWPNLQLLQSELSFNMIASKMQINVSYLFQKRELLEKREYLSTIPHFLQLHAGVPLSKYATLVYEAQFYAQQRSSLFFIDGIKPLIHRVRLEYDGHCWGFFIGFEEKNFRECGIGRTERAIVFSLRLDSLGSFAKKFKRNPQLVHSSAI